MLSDAEHWSLQSELDRKTLAAIESLYTRLQEGEVTRHAVHTAACSLYDAVAGLADSDLIDALEQLIKEVKPSSGEAHQVMLSDDEASLVLMKRGNDSFEIGHYKRAKTRSINEPWPSENESKWTRFIKQLQDMEFDRL